jgi:hypothetical protein
MREGDRGDLEHAAKMQCSRGSCNNTATYIAPWTCHGPTREKEGARVARDALSLHPTPLNHLIVNTLRCRLT